MAKQGRSETGSEARDVAKGTIERVKDENLILVSAGVAFWATISIVPAAIATTTIYGLVASPASAESNVRSLFSSLSPSTQSSLTSQFHSVASSGGSALGVGLAVSLAALLWSASSGMQNMLKAISVSLTGTEDRTFVKLRSVALLWALGAIVLAAITVGVMAIVPGYVGHWFDSSWAQWAIRVVGWVPLLAVVALGIAALYRFGPDKDRLGWKSALYGGIGATVVWIIATIGLGIYLGNFGNYSNVYGSLVGAILLMLWMYLTCVIVLVGAVVTAEVRREAGGADARTGGSDTTGRPASARGDVRDRDGHRGDGRRGNRRPVRPPVRPRGA
jgi:membrane protein